MAQFQGYPEPMYGTMFAADEALTIGSQNTYVGYKALAEVTAVGVTTDTSDATADHFTIPTGGAGNYLISYTITGFSATPADTIETKVHVGGTADDNSRSLMKHTDGDVQGASACYIRSLSDADEVDIRSQNTTAGRNFTAASIQFSITRLHS
jgi:hypothetical protein